MPVANIDQAIDELSAYIRFRQRGNGAFTCTYDPSLDLYATEDDALMQAGAQMVKMEGGVWLSDSINALVERGIPVCAHLGLTPQSVNVFGGYRVQGRTPKEAKSILADAVEIQDAGASLLVLECVPARVAGRIAERLTLPVIGIGAGPLCDGQVLVTHDMLGLFDKFIPKFVKQYTQIRTIILDAMNAYKEDVQSEAFPGPEHSFKMPEETLEQLKKEL